MRRQQAIIRILTVGDIITTPNSHFHGTVFRRGHLSNHTDRRFSVLLVDLIANQL